MNVLIVSKTRMYAEVCVGAISLDRKESLRLLSDEGTHQPCTTPFEVGTIWHIEGRRPDLDKRKEPHTENFIVTSMSFVGKEPDIPSFIYRHAHVTRGDVTSLYDSSLRWTSRGRGYISQLGPVPSYSTAFWITGSTLELEWEDEKPYYSCYVDNSIRSIKYVGFVDPVSAIPEGSLVRVSLARWWTPMDAVGHLEPRCYLQLSGWYGCL